MRKFALAAAIVAATAVVSGQANAADVLTKLTSQRLSDIMKSAGATDVQVTKPEAGVEIVSASDGNGTIDFVLLNCAADGCTTLQMSVVFNKDDRLTLAAVNGYNATYLNAQAALRPSGQVQLARLYLPMGGVTEDNLKVNIAIFSQAPELLSKHVLSQVTASLDKPTMKPASAEPAKPAKPSVLNLAAPATGEFDVVKWHNAQPNRAGRSIP